MLKPFKGLNFDDFLHAEIHLNEIMVSQQDNQQLEQMKESRKRHMRILQAALKECIVDPQVVISICVQVSRQAFYNELNEYFQCAYESIVTPGMNSNTQGTQPSVSSAYPQSTQSASSNQNNPSSQTAQSQSAINSEIQNYYTLKRMIQKIKGQAKVQIHHNKKLDKMFKVLCEQNTDVLKQITTYKEKYEQKKNSIIENGLESSDGVYQSKYAIHRASQLNSGRNQSALETNKDASLATVKNKKQTISVDQEGKQQQQQLQQNGSFRSGNNTMQHFYNTPQVNSAKGEQITVRLGNQKIMGSKILEPISNKNLSNAANEISKTTDSLHESQHQYLEQLDLKNLKKLHQLPSIQHQNIHSGVTTPLGHQAQSLLKDSQQRGNSAENLLKLLYNNKNKKLLEPLPKDKDNFTKTFKKPAAHLDLPLISQQELSVGKHKSSPAKVITNQKQSQTKDDLYHQDRSKVNKYLMSHVSFSSKEITFDSQFDINNKSLSNINLKQSLASTSKSRLIKTSAGHSRHKFNRITKIPNVTIESQQQLILPDDDDDDKQLPPLINYEYKVDENSEGYLTRFFNKKEIINFMISRQARIIQKFYRDRYLEKVKAKKIIVKQWKAYAKVIHREQMLRSKIFLNTHKRAAKIIEKNYIAYKLRLKIGKWSQFINYSRIPNFMQSVMFIQRCVRKFLNKRYHAYRIIKNIYQQKVDCYNKLQQRYLPQAAFDSQRLQLELDYHHFNSSLDDYAYSQQLSYMASLDVYEERLEEAVESNLDKREWAFNSASREWSNQRLNLTLKNTYQNNGQQPIITTPQQKLIELNKKSFMPSEVKVNQEMDALGNVRGMIENEMNQERLEQRWRIEKMIKIQRIRRLE